MTRDIDVSYADIKQLMRDRQEHTTLGGEYKNQYSTDPRYTEATGVLGQAALPNRDLVS